MRQSSPETVPVTVLSDARRISPFGDAAAQSIGLHRQLAHAPPTAVAQTVSNTG